MPELSATPAAAAEPVVTEPTGAIRQTDRRVLDFLFSFQRALMEGSVFAVDEWFDRARTEAHLLAEFVSKLAEAHSVNNIQTMYQECAQHQIDFMRRDCDRLFKNSSRAVEALSNLVDQA